MKSITNVGLIECGVPGKLFQLQGVSKKQGYNLKKILFTSAVHPVVPQQFGQAEIVSDKASILHDTAIDLVIVSAQNNADPELITEVLQSGKHLRIV